MLTNCDGIDMDYRHGDGPGDVGRNVIPLRLLRHICVICKISVQPLGLMDLPQ